MKALLQIVTGDGRAGIIDLETGTYSIGRDDDAEIKINSRDVSRKHAQLIVEDNVVRIVDCGSANGTNVNGAPVTTGNIQDGDRIQIGDVIFQFQSKNARPSVAIPRQERDALTTRKPKVGAPRETIAKSATPSIPAKTFALQKLSAIIFSSVFGLLLLLSGLSYRSMLRERLESEATLHAQTLVRYLADKNREDLRVGNELLLDIDSIAKERGVREALLINAKGRIVAPINRLAQIENDPFTLEALNQNSDRIIMPGPEMSDGTRVLVHPIRAYDDKTGTYQTLGVAKIIYSSDEAVGSLPEANRMIGFMVLLAVGCSFGLAWFFTRRLNGPLHRLAENLQQWRTGQHAEKTAAPFTDWEPLFKAVDQVMEEKQR